MIFYTNLLFLLFLIVFPWVLTSFVFANANKGFYSYGQVIYNLIFLVCSVFIFIVFIIDYNVFPHSKTSFSFWLILSLWAVSFANFVTFSIDIFKVYRDTSAKKREAKKITESLDQ